MTNVEAVSRLAAGTSAACVFFAFAVLITRLRGSDRVADPAATRRAWRLNALAWSVMAIAALVYRPVHIFWLLGHPRDALVGRIADLLGSSLGCFGFVLVLAGRDTARGLLPSLVRHRLLINCSTALGITGATWLAR